MKRRIISILVTIIGIGSMCQAQTSGRQRNTIYVLDCTGSMNGYNGAPDIWDPTKTFLKNELTREASQNPDSRITILPFQEKVLTPITVDTRQVGWSGIEAQLNTYIRRLTATNICDSWRAAEGYIDPVCENYIVLMTDGHDNIGGASNEANRTEELNRILQEFCGKYPNTHGFYVELTKSASLPDIVRHTIDVCNDIDIVDASQGIPSFGGVNDDVIPVNTRDLPAIIPLGFSNSGTFKASVSEGDNEYVGISIKDGTISHGQLTVVIESKYGDDIEQLNSVIGEDNVDIEFVVASDDVIITNPGVTVRLFTAPIRSLDMAGENCCETSVDRIKPFLWIKGNETDTLRWNLNPVFSEQAILDNSRAIFSINADSIPAGCNILFDGHEVKGNTIALTPGIDGVIEVIVPTSVPDDEATLRLTPVKVKDLDRINGNRPDGSPITLNGEIDTSMSLAEILFWSILGLILLFIILWFAIIRPSRYPHFKRGIITIKSPYYATIRPCKEKARMVVMTPHARSQGWLDSIVKGKIIYHVNPAWPCEVIVTPSGKSMRMRCPSGQLLSDPLPLWQQGMEYKLLDTANSNKPIIEININ